MGTARGDDMVRLGFLSSSRMVWELLRLVYTGSYERDLVLILILKCKRRRARGRSGGSEMGLVPAEPQLQQTDGRTDGVSMWVLCAGAGIETW
jgi:hypothetical protein